MRKLSILILSVVLTVGCLAMCSCSNSSSEVGKVVYTQSVMQSVETHELTFNGTESCSQDVQAVATSAIKDDIDAGIGELDEMHKALVNFYYELTETALRHLDRNVELAKKQATEVYTAFEEVYAQIKADYDAQKQLEETEEVDWAKWSVEELDKTIQLTLTKIKDEELKQELQGFYAEEVLKLQTITEENCEDVLEEVANDLHEEIKELFQKDLKFAVEKTIVETDKKVKEALETIQNPELKKELEDFYAEEVKKFETITEENCEEVFEEIAKDVHGEIVKLFTKDVEYVTEKFLTDLDKDIKDALANIKDEDLKIELQGFYATEVAKLQTVTYENYEEVFEEVAKDVHGEIVKLFTEDVKKLAAQIAIELDAEIKDALAQITDEELKLELQGFYATEVAKLQTVTYENHEEVFEEVLNDVHEEIQKLFAKDLAVLKAALRADLDAEVAETLGHVNNEKLKAELENFYATEIAKIDAITTYEEIDEVAEEIAKDFASELEKIASDEELLKSAIQETIEYVEYATKNIYDFFKNLFAQNND